MKISKILSERLKTARPNCCKHAISLLWQFAKVTCDRFEKIWQNAHNWALSLSQINSDFKIGMKRVPFTVSVYRNFSLKVNKFAKQYQLSLQK